jgi:hypothetical protein
MGRGPTVPRRPDEPGVRGVAEKLVEVGVVQRVQR